MFCVILVLVISEHIHNSNSMGAFIADGFTRLQNVNRNFDLIVKHKLLNLNQIKYGNCHVLLSFKLTAYPVYCKKKMFAKKFRFFFKR